MFNAFRQVGAQLYYIGSALNINLNLNLQHLIKITDDCSNTMQHLQLGDLKLNENLKQSHFEKIRTEIIANLCAKIETFLRLEVHSHLQLDKMNPFVQNINDYRDLINVCPLLLNSRYVVLKGQSSS